MGFAICTVGGAFNHLSLVVRDHSVRPDGQGLEEVVSKQNFSYFSLCRVVVFFSTVVE